jgi:tellurite resistance protein TerC
MWIFFATLVVALLALDLLVFHRHAKRESIKAAALWSLFWVGLGLAFALFVWEERGGEQALKYLTAFLVEKSLSVDNLFVFLALFAFFGVAPEYQHRVLFWGIIGAIVTRGLFIFAGVELLQNFHWLIYVLGAVLVLTGLKLAFGKAEEVEPEKNPIVRWARKALPLTQGYRGERFLVREGGKLLFTPLVIVLIAIETTDVMFAVDSVPAVIAISQDLFVVYSSNIFAILGLRALYFLLSGAIGTLRFLRPSLALILMLIGVKMLADDLVHISAGLSLAVVGGVLVFAVVLSLLRPAPAKPE